MFILGELSAVPHPSIPRPASAHTLPKPRARGSFPAAQPRPTSHHKEGESSRGEVGMFRRDIRVSDAKRGRVPCRSKEHAASTRQKIKPQTIRPGACGAADGLEGGNPERARECISAWKRFPSWFKKKDPSPFSERFWKSG